MYFSGFCGLCAFSTPSLYLVHAILCMGLLVLCFSGQMAVFADCGEKSLCSGHGKCLFPQRVCHCDDGWGGANDIAVYKSITCSQRTCPSGKSWADVPTSSTIAHAITECSDRGLCNRVTGECKCFQGFHGAACNRMACPTSSEDGSECSGHGRCVAMKYLAGISEAMPLATNTIYSYFSDAPGSWDGLMTMGCVCDSSWKVGLQNGETQVAEWFGADCSLRHCPSGDDPRTTQVETNCTNTTANRNFTGTNGNLCHVECSNRGTCDYTSGICTCFNNYYGAACELTSELAEKSMNL